MRNLKYLNYTVTCQEVPNEVSLIINISGCPYHCKGCHSKYLWEYKGNYVINDLNTLINKYHGLISCVCFMGGDQNINELKVLLKTVKNIGLKTCVYSGCDDKKVFDNIIDFLDYLKIGHYDENLGGLKSKTTNQHMYDIKNNKEIYFYKKEK